MKETQESISQWADETFGFAGSLFRVATRANEELSELLRKVGASPRPTSDEDVRELGLECADVAIVMYRLAWRCDDGGALQRHKAWLHFEYGDGRGLRDPQKSPFYATLPELAAAANSTMARLIAAFASFDESSMWDGSDFDALFRSLWGICRQVDLNLFELIDEKMVTNRGRRWRQDGSGHGYHIRAGSAAAARNLDRDP